MGPVDEPLQIHVDQPRVVLQGDLPEEPEGADADVVHPHVDPPEAGQRRTGQARDVGGRAHVDLHGYRGPFCSRDLGHQLVQHGLPPRRHDDVRTRRGERVRRAAADAARGPDEHHDGVGQRLGALGHGTPRMRLRLRPRATTLDRSSTSAAALFRSETAPPRPCCRSRSTFLRRAAGRPARGGHPVAPLRRRGAEYAGYAAARAVAPSALAAASNSFAESSSCFRIRRRRCTTSVRPPAVAPSIRPR